MRKIFLGLMMLLFIITLAACGNTEETTQSQQNGTEETQHNDANQQDSTPGDDASDQDDPADSSDEATDEEDTSDADDEPEEALPAIDVNLFSSNNDLAAQFNREFLEQPIRQYGVGQTDVLTVEVIYFGGPLFTNEYTLVIIPGSYGNYTQISNIIYNDGSMTITGLAQGVATYRIQVYVGGELMFTSSELEIIIN